MKRSIAQQSPAAAMARTGRSAVKLALLLSTTAILWGAVGSASATVFYIDQFTIYRNDPTLSNPWFQDGFDDGSPPPSSPWYFPNRTNPASYLTIPTPMPGPESNSRLKLDTDAGARINSGLNGRPLLWQQARLQTNTDSNDLARGLKIDDTFVVGGLFDLIQPTRNRERYGVRVNDGGSTENTGPGDRDVIEVTMNRNKNGVVALQFAQNNYLTGTRDVINQVLLSSIANIGNYDQVWLGLAKLFATDDQGTPVDDRQLIAGGFALIDSTGSVNPYVFGFNGTGSIFHGEQWTRAEFIAGRTVPEPATLALLGIGLAGLGFSRRRRAPD